MPRYPFRRCLLIIIFLHVSGIASQYHYALIILCHLIIIPYYLSMVQPAHFRLSLSQCYAIVILGLRSYLSMPSIHRHLRFNPSFLSRVCPVASRLSSLRSCDLHLRACQHLRVYVRLSIPSSIVHLARCSGIYVYPRQGCHAPSVGRHLCVSFFVLALLGVSRTPRSRLLAGCSTYPILVVAYRLSPNAYCLLPIACRCRCYVSRQDQVRFPFCRVVNFESSSPIIAPAYRLPSPPMPPCSPASPRFRQYVSNASPSALHACRCRPHLYAYLTSTVHGSRHASSAPPPRLVSFIDTLASRILPAQPGFPLSPILRLLLSSALFFAPLYLDIWCPLT